MQDIAVVAALPVDVALERVLISVLIVLVSGRLESLRLHAAGHQKEAFDIVPSDPIREQRLHRIDAVADLTVDRNEVIVHIRPGFIDVYAIPGQFIDRIGRDQIWNGSDVFDVIPKRISDRSIVLLEACPDPAEVSDDPCVLDFIDLFILGQIQSLLTGRGEVLLFHADQIADERDDMVSRVSVVCVRIGRDSGRSGCFLFSDFHRVLLLYQILTSVYRRNLIVSMFIRETMQHNAASSPRG